MRRKIVAGNWKMNLVSTEAKQLTAELVGMIKSEIRNQVTIVIAPPFVHLNAVAQLIDKNGANIYLGAQNCATHVSGAYTGEVSAAMIAGMGGAFIIIGHSERRQYFKETDKELAEKVNRVLENNMQPIFCCGESQDERNGNRHFEVVSRQVEAGLFHLDAAAAGKLVIAYEPVWAIGTGLTATPEQAQEMHAHIRTLLQKKYGPVAQDISILYGGSCNEQNAASLFALPDIDGGLIGGASLKSRSFVKIISALN
jgi:triosephosphate isomerase (TIM)